MPVRVHFGFQGEAWDVTALCVLAAFPAFARQAAPPPKPQAADLADLSLEDLANIQVISVSKRPEKLSEAPAAIFVITREDIRRSGATSLPEALRLAPNLEVARIDSYRYGITARGFNSQNGNKLLVLIDGRTVYTPLYSGVWWDSQDLVLEDVDRIEVISGPGGTLWGSNAVNGVINIITRSAKDTPGVLLSGAAGKVDRSLTSARYGGQVGGAAFRVYGKYSDHDHSERADGTPVKDAWHLAQAGFRLDWGEGGDVFTAQGDAYKSAIQQAVPEDVSVEGGNVLGRWQHGFTGGSSLKVQIYFDRARRDYPNLLGESTDTADLDAQYAFQVGARNSLVLGGGYRHIDDQVGNSASIAFLPPHRNLSLSNLFVQDTLALIPEKLDLVLGLKEEHNDFTGWEDQPNLRLAWKPEEHQLVWTGVSRAVRTPSLLDKDYFVPGTPPYLLAGGPDFRSESVVAYEAGYRLDAPSRFSFSATAFYNRYRDLRSLEPDFSLGSYVIANKMRGHTYGLELWGSLAVTPAWSLRPAYTLLRESLELAPDSLDPVGTRAEVNDPRHQILLTSLWNAGARFEFDGTLRHVSALPDPAVPAYTTLDVHFGWKPLDGLEVALIGQNLFNKLHPEFGAPATRSVVERTGLVRLTWAF